MGKKVNVAKLAIKSNDTVDKIFKDLGRKCYGREWCINTPKCSSYIVRKKREVYNGRIL
jgi:hypothetical protein